MDDLTLVLSLHGYYPNSKGRQSANPIPHCFVPLHAGCRPFYVRFRVFSCGFFYRMTCIAGGLQVGLNNGPSSRLTPALGDAKNKKSIFASNNQVKRCCWSYVVFGRSSYQLRFASETCNPIDSKIWCTSWGHTVSMLKAAFAVWSDLFGP